LNSLIENYLESFKTYNGHKAVQEIMNFILNDLSRWYIKLIRDRTWPLYEGKDKDAAFYTLVLISENLVKLLAPICPFIAEDVHQNVLKKFSKVSESVHMYEFPKPEKKLINKKLEEEMEVVKQIFELSNFARQKVNLKLRWPVKQMLVITKDRKIKSAVKNLKSVMMDMCNVKSVKTATKEPKGNFAVSEFEKNKILLDLSEDKGIFEDRLYRELTRKIQEMRKDCKFIVNDRIKLTLKSDTETEKSLKKFVNELKKDVGAKSVDVGDLIGDYSGELEFNDKKIMLKFSKVI
jgi:isoleucyl-tRNA synthetase